LWNLGYVNTIRRGVILLATVLVAETGTLLVIGVVVVTFAETDAMDTVARKAPGH
jgi:hypothetical protein